LLRHLPAQSDIERRTTGNDRQAEGADDQRIFGRGIAQFVTDETPYQVKGPPGFTPPSG